MQNNKLKRGGLSVVGALFLMLLLSSFQQDDKLKLVELLQEAKQWYLPSLSYEIDLRYKIFKEHTNTAPEEEYNGKIVVSKNRLYNRLHETETIQVGKDQVRINHIEKAILHSEAPAQHSLDVVNLEKFPKAFESVKITEEGKYIKCVLISPKVTQMPYSKVEIYLTKKDKKMHKQVLYFLHKVNYTKSTSDETFTSTPKMEIVFSESKKIADYSIFNIAKYIQLNSEQKFVPSKEFKTYSIDYNYESK